MASSSSTAIRRYHVFPSFHGPDVRKGFLSHLHNHFASKGIRTFKDHEIERGHTIGPELFQAIKESRISIVVFSKEYASSSWCLDELFEIFKCAEDFGQIVMTIFYEVNPSDVRKQTGDFGKAFEQACERKTEDVKQRWRKALDHVATIAGEHSLNWASEAEMIQKIATDVLEKLNVTPSRDFEGMVGLEAHLNKLDSLLGLRCDTDVKIIGIWGPAGIGKSTIARALYDQVSTSFQLKCIMGKLKGKCKSLMGCDDYDFKLSLQSKLLSKILNQKNMKVHHLGAIKEWLQDQRVLIILDDVDDLEQLEALAKELSWFGFGSRIIVTTEDKKILKAHEIQDIYHVDFPSKEEALEIFCLSAFKQRSVKDGYEELAKKVVYFCGNLPLGLCVVGSSLRGESKDEWERQLSMIETTLDRKIEEILRVGYDRLPKKYQSLFLHIACFFSDEVSGNVVSVLSDSNLDVGNGIMTLADKSLVSISMDGKIRMHHLLQQLGGHIVLDQSEEPGKRQFLIEANSRSSGKEYRLPLCSLKILDLIFSRNLKEIPNLSNATNLETLNLTCCKNLVELPSSSSNLHKLKKLYMSGCEKLRELPANINLASLEEVRMNDCSLLRSFPNISCNIKTLVVRDSMIEDIPPSIVGCWSRLEFLDIGSRYLEGLTHDPQSITSLDISNSSIKEIPDCVICLQHLKILIVDMCPELKSISALPPCLDYLYADECVSLKRVCFSFQNPTKLLIFSNCWNLDEESTRKLVQQSIYRNIMLPGKEIPAEFIHKSTGNSVTISLASGTFSASSRFKACFLILPLTPHYGYGSIRYSLISRGGRTEHNFDGSRYSHECWWSEHMFLVHGDFSHQENKCHVTTNEITFEFTSSDHNDKIIECGVQIMTEEAEGSSSSNMDNFETESCIREVDNSDTESCISKTLKHRGCWSWLICCFEK